MNIPKPKFIKAYLTLLFFLFPIYIYSQHMSPILYNYLNYNGQHTFYQIYYVDVEMLVYVISASFLGLALKKFNFHFYKLMILFNVIFCYDYWVLIKEDVTTFLLAGLAYSLLLIPVNILYWMLKKFYRWCYDTYLIVRTKPKKTVLKELIAAPFFQALAFTITVFLVFFLLIYAAIQAYLTNC